MQNTFKKLSKRAVFKQMLMDDVLNIIDDFGGTYIALTDLREQFRTGNFKSDRFYFDNMYTSNWSFTSWDDRWYRALQSINNGKELAIKKLNGRLYAFADASDNFKHSLMEMGARDWDRNYNR